jgi:hypothetical protein
VKEQLKTIIDAFFDDWECPSNKVYSDDLATSLDKAIGIDREKVIGIVAQAWCAKENEHKEMDTVLGYTIVDAITQSRPLKCEVDMVGFEGTYDALNKLTHRKA